MAYIESTQPVSGTSQFFFIHIYDSLIYLRFICLNDFVINSFIALKIKMQNICFGHFLYFDWNIDQKCLFWDCEFFEDFYFIQESDWRNRFYFFVYYLFMNFFTFVKVKLSVVLYPNQESKDQFLPFFYFELRDIYDKLPFCKIHSLLVYENKINKYTFT